MTVRRWVLGTAEDCDLRLTDEYASSHHALIERDDTGHTVVADLGSTNGTRLERAGQRIRVTAPTPIQPGDVLIVGRTRIPWTPTA